MRLLALETATRRLSVALWLDGQVQERDLDSTTGGSEWLLPTARALLADAGVALTDLDGLAFGRGPGAFTGLRLAAGCVQGLAFGLDLPVIGISSLEALAEASGESKVYACLDARMHEVYVAAYLDGIEVMTPTVVAPAMAPVPPGDGWVGCGDAFAVYPSDLPRFERTRSGLLPTAVAVARLAAARWSSANRLSAGDAIPMYVRNRVALTTAERVARGGVR
jgi:tRNA threonylcarbamoyladenosine biosynthesis protein TsaB